MATTHMTMTGTETTSVGIGTKYVRWGLGLFIFGLVIGYGPWLHYMHGALEDVHEQFLKNVTLWFGCPWTLPVYVTQLGGLSMVVFGLCYLAFARDGAMSSVSSAERMAPVLCATGIVTEFVFGFPLYFAVNAVWPDFYFTPIRDSARLHPDLCHRRDVRLRRHQARLAHAGISRLFPAVRASCANADISI